jgi:hypothetical protein
MTDLEAYLAVCLPLPYFTESWVMTDNGSREIILLKAGSSTRIHGVTVSQHDFFYYSELWDRVLEEFKFCITFTP